ncbi:MAG: hypothetical protein CMF69_00195 [Magnetovibrio sp.]|nr:hypothetical protein [Magnetovibrio sp.]MBM88217.1 hypothetical protein [Gammaproteobacteria bacterium]
MGYFAKIASDKKRDGMETDTYDPKNPFTTTLEDEGKWISILNVINQKEAKAKEEEEEEDGSTSN